MIASFIIPINFQWTHFEFKFIQITCQIYGHFLNFQFMRIDWPFRKNGDEIFVFLANLDPF